MPYSPMQKHCTHVKNLKGKTTGLMMERSAMHMSMLHKESAEQEKKDLMKDMPVDDKASAMEMSPYKMGHESPAEFTGMSGGSALHQKDERSGEGVTVTGDASKVGGKTTMTEAEKKRAKLKKRIEDRKIREANEKMERKMKTETTKAEIAKRRIAREQGKRKKEGKDYMDTTSGKVVRRR